MKEIIDQEKKDQRPSWWRIVIWLGLFILLAILAFGLLRSRQGPVAVGSKAPEFDLTTFDGEHIELQDIQGKIIVVNFWASWCNPCGVEAADLEAAWKYYKPDGKVVFLGIDYVDTDTEAMEYIEKYGITYPNGPDLGTRISQSFRIGGVPETYIIDRDGVLRYKKFGPFGSLAQIKAVIDPLLDQ